MKKIVVLFFTLLLVFNVSACGTSESTENMISDSSSYGMFVKVGNMYGAYIVYDRDTGLMYTISNYQGRGICLPLYNADGTLKIWGEFAK